MLLAAYRHISHFVSGSLLERERDHVQTSCTPIGLLRSVYMQWSGKGHMLVVQSLLSGVAGMCILL
jgi:hypothetical protein